MRRTYMWLIRVKQDPDAARQVRPSRDRSHAHPTFSADFAIDQRVSPREPGKAVQVPEVQACVHLHRHVPLPSIATGHMVIAEDRRPIEYVFDGTSPPYTPSSTTNPLNLYGKTKRDGELAVLGVSGAKSIALRVPVL